MLYYSDTTSFTEYIHNHSRFPQPANSFPIDASIVVMSGFFSNASSRYLTDCL